MTAVTGTSASSTDRSQLPLPSNTSSRPEVRTVEAIRQVGQSRDAARSQQESERNRELAIRADPGPNLGRSVDLLT